MNNEVKYENYMYIKNCIQTIKSGNVMTDDWILEQKKKLLQYRQWISNFSMVNNEIRNVVFRQIASNTELILDNLIKSEFDISLYLMFNQNLVYLLDYFVENDDDSKELELLFERFSVN